MNIEDPPSLEKRAQEEMEMKADCEFYGDIVGIPYTRKWWGVGFHEIVTKHNLTPDEIGKLWHWIRRVFSTDVDQDELFGNPKIAAAIKEMEEEERRRIANAITTVWGFLRNQ